MPTVTHKSTDAGAATLNGTVGSLITVLDQCLVNGNGTSGKAAAGWTKPYSGTNLAVYRAATAGSGIGAYLNVDDAAQGATAGAREARLRGALTANQANTGTAVTGMTEPTPTTGVSSIGGLCLKSATADSVARAWICHADAKSVTFLSFPGNLNGYSTFYAGEIASDSAGDAYRFALIARAVEHVHQGDVSLDTDEVFPEFVSMAAGSAGHFIMRSIFSGGAGQVVTTYGKHSGDVGKRNLVPYIAGRPVYQAPIWLHEDQGAFGIPRGRLRGVWDVLHTPWAIPFGTTWSGTGALAGKTFEYVGPLGLTNIALTSMSGLILETSDTWETTT